MAKSYALARVPPSRTLLLPEDWAGARVAVVRLGSRSDESPVAVPQDGAPLLEPYGMGPKPTPPYPEHQERSVRILHEKNPMHEDPALKEVPTTEGSVLATYQPVDIRTDGEEGGGPVPSTNDPAHPPPTPLQPPASPSPSSGGTGGAAAPPPTLAGKSPLETLGDDAAHPWSHLTPAGPWPTRPMPKTISSKLAKWARPQDLVCSTTTCKAPLPRNAYEYSLRKYGAPFCFSCQRQAIL